MPFFPIWLASKNLGPGQISIVLALPLLIRILVSPALVGLADRLPSLRVAGALYAFVAAALFAVPLFVSGFWVILFFTGAALMFWSALGPFTEAVILYGVRTARHRICARAALGLGWLHVRESCRRRGGAAFFRKRSARRTDLRLLRPPA